MKKSIVVLLFALSIVMGGCASTGQYAGLNPDPARWMIIYNSLGLPLTKEQRELVAEVIIEAAKVVDEQLGSTGDASAVGAFSNAIASAVATALTVSGPLGTVMAIEAAQSAAGGVTDARTTVSYARVYAGATIAETLILDRIAAKVPGYAILENVHVVPAFVASTNTMEGFRRR